MIKMLASDIDGTIFNKKFECSEDTRDCIKNLSNIGVRVVLSTGRMYRATAPIAKYLGLTTPVISYQGALVKNFYDNQETLYSVPTSSKIACEVIEILRKKKIHTHLYLNDKLYVESDDAEIASYTTQRYITYTHVKSFNDLKIENVNKVLAIKHDENVINDLTVELQERYKEKLYIVKSTPYFCEISNPYATKGNAVRFLANLWGIKKEEILAIGDQDNDIELLKSAGIAVAMGNATSTLKSYADYVTDTVDNDGIKKAIEKFILN